MNQNVTNNAIPFISYIEKQFKINPEAAQFLQSIPSHKHLAIISIVGKYRTGKSFFVNRVLLEKQANAFQVGSTINPCTKVFKFYQGLWIWKNVIETESKQTDALIIDVQGFGGMDQNSNNDSKIFLIGLLLSSYFIYNSVGSIDQNALNTLNLIINLSKQVHYKSEIQVNKFYQSSFFPYFLWVVRDFTLKIQDKHGQALTQKEYLQRALQNQKGISDSVQNKNRIRRLFKQFFKQRDCVTLVRPTQQQSDLQNLNEIHNDDLRPYFVKQMRTVRKKIFSKLKPKMINHNKLNGSTFLELVNSFLKVLNDGGIPNIQNTWHYVYLAQARKTIKSNFDQLESIQGIEKELFKQRQVMEQYEIAELRIKMKKDYEKLFDRQFINGALKTNNIEKEMELQFDKMFEKFIAKNKLKCQQKISSIAQKNIKPFADEFQILSIKGLKDYFGQIKTKIRKNFEGYNWNQKQLESIENKMYIQAIEKVCIKHERKLNNLEEEVKSEKELNEKKQKKLNEYKKSINKLQKQVQKQHNEKKVLTQNYKSTIQNMEVDLQAKQNKLKILIEKHNQEKKLLEQKHKDNSKKYTLIQEQLQNKIKIQQNKFSQAQLSYISSIKQMENVIKEKDFNYIMTLKQKEFQYTSNIKEKDAYIRSKEIEFNSNLKQKQLEWGFKTFQLEEVLKMKNGDIEKLSNSLVNQRHEFEQETNKMIKEHSLQLNKKIQKQRSIFEEEKKKLFEEYHQQLQLKDNLLKNKDKIVKNEFRKLEEQYEKVQELNKNKQKLKKSYDKIKSERDQLKEKNQNLIDQKNKLDNLVSHFRCKIQLLQNQLQNLKNQKSNSDMKAKNLATKISNMFQQQQDRINGIIKKSEIENQERQNKLNVVEKEKNQLEYQLENLKNKLKKNNYQWVQQIQKLNKEIVKMKGQIQKKESNNQIAMKQLQLRKKNYIQVDKKNQILAKDYYDLIEINQHLCKQIQKLQMINQTLKTSLMNKQSQKSKQFKIFKDELQRPKKIKSSNELQIEKSYLQNQIAMQNKFLNENQLLINALVAIQKKFPDKDDQKSYLNTQLSKKYQEIQLKYKQKSEKYQQLKNIVIIFHQISAVISMMCISCKINIPKQEIQAHLAVCQFKNQNYVKIIINQTIIKQQQGKAYTEYYITVYSIKQSWHIRRTVKDFCHLTQKLNELFPNVKQPIFSKAFNLINDITNKKSNNKVEQMKKYLEQYINECLSIQEFKNSKPMLQFLSKENENYKQIISQQNSGIKSPKMQRCSSNIITFCHQQNIRDKQKQNFLFLNKKRLISDNKNNNSVSNYIKKK